VIFWLLHSGRCSAAFNMALDEALLENISAIGQPLLRFYGWTEPAATFGYFQKFSEIERATPLRPLVRRPTGGGLVPHDADWTYSFIAPPQHQWYSLKAQESYRRMHEWIRAAFAGLNMETQLAPFKKTEIPGACFAGHEKFDVLWRGRKIAGAAQRRNRLGLLIQGSVQPPPFPCSRSDWENAMRRTAQENFQITWREFVLDESLRLRAEKLSQQKYAQDHYNRKR
jgi:lipoate-protein ligase A